MSKFTQPEETMIVKNAMELTATIMLEENELNKVKSDTFRSSPNPPVRKVLSQPNDIRPQYPPKPTTTYSYTDYLKELISKYKIFVGIAAIAIIILSLLNTIFSVLLILFVPVCLFAVLIYTYFSYCAKRKTLNQQLSESPEYLQAVENAEKEAEKQQKELAEKSRQEQEKLDAEYEEKKRHYENVTVPEYNRELNNWKSIQEKKRLFLEEELKYNNEALNDLYETSKLISATYRDLWILKWLYEDMSTSDHDIRYATELLDRDRQRLVTEEAGKRTESAVHDIERTMKTGFNAIYNAIEYGNELQEDSIEILNKTRRDNNVSNLLGTVQRHNTNKALKGLLSK